MPGQHADGTFDVAVSRTLTGDRDQVIAGFAELVDDRSQQGLSPDEGVNLKDLISQVSSAWSDRPA